jgi:hypothetical protein
VSGPGDLHLAAVELLEASVNALDTIPSSEPTLDGAPERAFVAPGQPALDCCPQLTVHSTQSQFMAPSVAPLDQGRRPDRVNGPSFMVTIVRCIPRGPEPAIADMEAAAEQVNADGWALWNHLFNLWGSGDLFTVCGVLNMDLQPLNPSGGCAGWRLTVRTKLDGYNADP